LGAQSCGITQTGRHSPWLTSQRPPLLRQSASAVHRFWVWHTPLVQTWLAEHEASVVHWQVPPAQVKPLAQSVSAAHSGRTAQTPA
jgi:hypothetical protein